MYFNVYALPVVISALLGYLLAYFAKNFKLVPGARQFAFLSAAAATYSLGYALEISSTEINIALLWVKLQYLGAAFLPAFIILFTLHYAGKGSWLNRKITTCLFVIPVITVWLVLALERHDLFYRDIVLYRSGLFPFLLFSAGPWYKVHIAYSVAATFLGIAVLFAGWRRSSSLFRRQIIIAVGAFLIPWATYVIFRTNALGRPFNLTAFSFSFSAVLFFISLFRYSMFSLPPLARSVLFEQMPDGVLVVDRFRQVVDLNKPARELLGLAGNVIGRPLDEVLQALPGGTGLCEKQQEKSVTCFRSKQDGTEHWYEVQVIPLKDPQNDLAGHMLIFRDITENKKNEEEIHNAYRNLDAIIEFLPDAIMAVNARGEVTIWNRAIEEMTGVKKEEILGKGGFAHSVPFYGEPRPMLIDMVLDQALEDTVPFQYFDKGDRSLTGEVFCPNIGEAGMYAWGKAAPLYDSQGRLAEAIETI